MVEEQKDSDLMNFLTKKRFTKMIEETVRDMKMPYMEAVCHICENNNIEVEDISKYISPVIKGRIEFEGQQLNMLPKGNMLPDGF
jgi:hypothetical protein|tara:strand:- start:26452 stop:26706 length:255 start_codon:yes stop_codon:yes gene_type:complete